MSRLVYACQLADLQSRGSLLVNLEQQTIALFYHQGQPYAIDNRCPHMGFPLHGSTCQDGILTCPWHYARFDLKSGGTFDGWADDVRSFPTTIQNQEIWLDLAAAIDGRTHQIQRLKDGLEQGISLVIAKAVIALLQLGVTPSEIAQIGLEFGTRYSKSGWGAGLTILTCMLNLLPYLDTADHAQALYHGLAAVAQDSSNAPPHFIVQPLPEFGGDFEQLKRWFWGFIELRDREAAERCLVTAIRHQASPLVIAEMLFTAATDHRYLDEGHTIDFINKALEALDAIAWQSQEQILTSLVAGLAGASRMEETSSWRYPVDLVQILRTSFEELPAALAAGRGQQWPGPATLMPILLGDDPGAIATGLLTALRAGATGKQLAQTVATAAALRVAQFNTNNDHSDWHSAHHPFTFSHAVHQALERWPGEPPLALFRGIFDGAMAVYLNRFLNVPPARVPQPQVADPEELLTKLPDLLDRQQQVGAIGQLVVNYLHNGGPAKQLLCSLAQVMLQENRDFHVIQEMDAAFRQYQLSASDSDKIQFILACSRYLAAHAPTNRSQTQTYRIAQRLHQGDRLHQS